MNNERWAEHLQLLRRMRGLTSAALATKAGVDPSSIWFLERGKRSVLGLRLVTAIKIADALQVSLDDLVRRQSSGTKDTPQTQCIITSIAQPSLWPEHFRLLRRMRGLNSSAMASRAGVNVMWLWGLENNRRQPFNITMKMAIKLADALDISLDDLIRRPPRPARVEDF